MIGIADRAFRSAAQVSAILPCQLFSSLHTALCTTRSTLGACQQGQAAVQVRTAAAQDVAFAQQRSHVTGQLAQAQGMAA